MSILNLCPPTCLIRGGVIIKEGRLFDIEIEKQRACNRLQMMLISTLKQQSRELAIILRMYNVETNY